MYAEVKFTFQVNRSPARLHKQMIASLVSLSPACLRVLSSAPLHKHKQSIASLVSLPLACAYCPLRLSPTTARSRVQRAELHADDSEAVNPVISPLSSSCYRQAFKGLVETLDASCFSSCSFSICLAWSYTCLNISCRRRMSHITSATMAKKGSAVVTHW